MQVRSQSENTTVFFFSCQLFKLPPIPVSVPRFPLFRSPLSYLRRASLSSAVGGPSAGETGQADGGVRSIWPIHLPLLLWTSWVSGGFCTRPSVQLIFGDCVRPEKVKFFAEICSSFRLMVFAIFPNSAPYKSVLCTFLSHSLNCCMVSATFA